MQHEENPIVEDIDVKFQQVEKPTKTFFFQRRDGLGDVIEDSPIFAANEQEAASTFRFHKLIGASDGMAYYNYMKNCGVKVGELIPLSRARKIMKEAFEAELEVARGKMLIPKYKSVTFDDSVLRHQNAEEIMRSFAPPGNT